MDDFIIIGKSKEELAQILHKIEENLHSKLGLELNDKTQIYPLHRGFTFLGWKYRLINNKLILTTDRSKLKDRKTTLKLIKKDYISNKIDDKEANNRLLCVQAHMCIGNTHRLQLNLIGYRTKNNKMIDGKYSIANFNKDK